MDEQNKTFPFGQKVVWQPNPEWIKNSNLQRLINRHQLKDYDALYQKSITDIEWFWNAVLTDLDIEFYQPYSKVVDLSKGIQFPEWCVDGKMNIVHNCLDKWQERPERDKNALIWIGENGEKRALLYSELFEAVNRCANALQANGIQKGDRIGLFMPMVPEIVVAFLAIIKIGAVILPLFSGYGPAAVAARIKDGEAKALFTADGFFRRGKAVAMKPVLDEALRECPSVELVIILPNISQNTSGRLSKKEIKWDDFLEGQSTACATEKTAAEDTVMLIYTSGTTGKPKGAVHTHCGFPLKAAQDMFHAMDVTRDSIVYWMSDMGWMMGPWLVFGTLLLGATMVLYDGAPDYPQVGQTWQMVVDHNISHLGISPTFIRSMMQHKELEMSDFDFSNLRMVGSTGSPWDPESWRWLFEKVMNSEKPILNYSGGTEISGGILCGNFFQPLKPCAFSGPVVGMAADVIDENGNSVKNAVGELVVRQPWIGMTRGFWQDKQRYLDTYWEKYPGMWLHGDYAAIDEDGLWYILGRSDDTIKIAGKRLGPAEVESIVNSHPGVHESAAIAVPHPVKDNEVVVFVITVQPQQVSEKLRDEILQLVIKQLGKPLKPREIKFCSALPKTRNAKVMHRVIRAVYLNESPGDLSSLENPNTVDAIRNAC